jgi:hypothetical protein
MPGSDWTSSNDDGLYIALSDVVALEAAGAWKAAAAPKVEARRSLECIVLFVCLQAVRASRAGGVGAWSRVVVSCVAAMAAVALLNEVCRARR